MSDLISREDAIDTICREWCLETFDNCPHADDGFRCVGCDDVEALMALPSDEAYFIDGNKIAEWIPCSERLPEKDDLVLVTVWNDVTIAWRNIYGGWESAEDMYEKGDVTAWMPLPKPYKGGDEE